MMKKGEIVLLIFAVAVVLVFSGCSSQENKAPKPTTEEQKTVETPKTTAEAGKTKEFAIIAKQFTFEPSTITVKKGDTVRINLNSVDVDHGIGIKEFNVNLKVDAGKTESVEFIADKAGTFTMFCNVFCGADHKNMKGTLVVEE